jgi:hypothetical protein
MQSRVFGMPIEYKKWQEQDKLALYIAEAYDFAEATIANKSCTVVTPKDTLATIPALKKQIAKIQQVKNIPVVFKLTSISNYRRQAFIENNISFITEKQAYLPFLGALLENEREIEPLQDKFAFSTQQLFLFYLYHHSKQVYLSEATRALPFSAMTISRAARQLQASGLFTTTKDKVNVVVGSELSPLELFKQAKCFLSSPVYKRGYIGKEHINESMALSGVSALSCKTMLSAPKVATYAIAKNGFNGASLTSELIDPEKQCELELWAYDPNLFGEDGCADSLSVALTFANTEDERIEMAIEKLVKKGLSHD